MQRRPVVGTVVGLAVLLGLALPSLALHLGVSDLGHEPVGSTVRAASDRMADGSGAGFDGPFAVIAELPDGDSTRSLARLQSA